MTFDGSCNQAAEQVFLSTYYFHGQDLCMVPRHVRERTWPGWWSIRWIGGLCRPCTTRIWRAATRGDGLRHHTRGRFGSLAHPLAPRRAHCRMGAASRASSPPSTRMVVRATRMAPCASAMGRR